MFLLKICLQKPGVYILHQFSRGHNQTPDVASNIQGIAELLRGYNSYRELLMPGVNFTAIK